MSRTFETPILLGPWLFCLGVLVLLGLVNGRTSGVQYFGIAESQEWGLSYDHSVKIKKIHVREGEKIKQGDLLVELEQQSSEVQLSNLKHSILELQAQAELTKSVGEDGIAELTELSLVPKFAPKAQNSPKQEEGPLAIEVKKLQAEVQFLEKSRGDLLYRSTFDGSLGSIKFQPGEVVPPHSVILSIHPTSPSFIKGYVREEHLSELVEGQRVSVFSLSQSSQFVNGTVATVSGRIVQLPARLSPFSQIPLFGREVLIQIPPNNPFIFGEKLGIREARSSWRDSLLSSLGIQIASVSTRESP